MEIARTCHAASYSYTAGVDAMRKLRAAVKVEAVFCGDDLICMGAMDFARASGLTTPADIGFLGANDIDMAGWTPSISQLSTNPSAISLRAPSSSISTWWTILIGLSSPGFSPVQ